MVVVVRGGVGAGRRVSGVEFFVFVWDWDRRGVIEGEPSKVVVELLDEMVLRIGGEC